MSPVLFEYNEIPISFKLLIEITYSIPEHEYFIDSPSIYNASRTSLYPHLHPKHPERIVTQEAKRSESDASYSSN